ncbi:MAG: enoyl-CoA hydratase [Gammaproteobacteria bacterium]|nr:MAG: enoyl-CoA hydratase [Gammaproteobacteria bacterium]
MRSITNKLIAEKDGAVGRITFNSPERRNAISYEMWQGIPVILDDFGVDGNIRVVVLSGAGGKAFSAGADVSQFESKRSSRDATDEYNAAVLQVTGRLRQFDKPTIACIEGYCLGGGLGVALACDLRIAGDDARFAIPAARLGLGYRYTSIRTLVELVGPAFAREILLVARQFNADEALAMGLVNRVLPRSQLTDYVQDYARRIAENAPLTLHAVKKIVDQTLRDPDARDLEMCDELVDHCFASEDYKEGRRAFMEKRKPKFTGH